MAEDILVVIDLIRHGARSRPEVQGVVMFSATDFSSQGKGIKRLILPSLSQFHASWSAQVQEHSF